MSIHSPAIYIDLMSWGLKYYRKEYFKESVLGGRGMCDPECGCAARPVCAVRILHRLPWTNTQLPGSSAMNCQIYGQSKNASVSKSILKRVRSWYSSRALNPGLTVCANWLRSIAYWWSDPDNPSVSQGRSNSFDVWSWAHFEKDQKSKNENVAMGTECALERIVQLLFNPPKSSPAVSVSCHRHTECSRPLFILWKILLNCKCIINYATAMRNEQRGFILGCKGKKCYCDTNPDRHADAIIQQSMKV